MSSFSNRAVTTKPRFGTMHAVSPRRGALLTGTRTPNICAASSVSAPRRCEELWQIRGRIAGGKNRHGRGNGGEQRRFRPALRRRAYGAGRGHHERISVPKLQLAEPGADGGEALLRGHLCHGDTAFLKYSQIVKETVKIEHDDEDADDGERGADGDLLCRSTPRGELRHTPPMMRPRIVCQ